MMIYIILFSCSYLESKEDARTIVKMCIRDRLKAAHMVPNRLYPLYLLAQMYNESGQIDKAITTARLLLEKDPKVPSSATEEMKRDMQKLIRNLQNPSSCNE